MPRGRGAHPRPPFRGRGSREAGRCANWSASWICRQRCSNTTGCPCRRRSTAAPSCLCSRRPSAAQSRHRLARRGVHPDQRVTSGTSDPHGTLEIQRLHARSCTVGRSAGRIITSKSICTIFRPIPTSLTNLIGVEAFRAVADDLSPRLIRRMMEAGEAAPAEGGLPYTAQRPAVAVLPPYPSGGADAGSHGQRTH